MESVILYANDSESAYTAANVLCDFIKNNDKYDHQLFFSHRFLGSFMISKGELDKNGKAHFSGSREVVVMPNDNHLDGHLQNSGKTVVYFNNCMCVCGDSEKKRNRLVSICDWVLGEDIIFDQVDEDMDS